MATAHRILEVRVEEATGKNKSSDRVWESDITEGFIKGMQSAPCAAAIRFAACMNADSRHRSAHYSLSLAS